MVLLNAVYKKCKEIQKNNAKKHTFSLFYALFYSLTQFLTKSAGLMLYYIRIKQKEKSIKILQVAMYFLIV